jgi:hypothetical protein
MRFLMLALISAAATAQNMAGFKATPAAGSVTQHSRIDLDQEDIEDALKVPAYSTAESIYKNGKNSAKSSGMRTIKYMVKDLSGEALFDQFKAYYKDAQFPDKWVMGALDKKSTAHADFSTVSDDDTREQAIKKGTVQMIIWPYAVHELESAMAFCDQDTNKAQHYLDEAVAFYTGSLVGADASGSTKGKLMFGLAQSRCKDFVTCASGTSGLAGQTRKVFAKFKEFQTALNSKACGDLKALTKSITDAGYTAIIQGTLKYGHTVGAGGASTKYKAEAATFAMAVLPRVHTCSPTDAKTIYDNLKIGAASTNFAAVKAALENNYACMGVTCTEVGAYTKDDVQKFDPCSDGLDTTGLIIVIAVAVVVVFLGLVVFLKKRNKKPPA